MAISTLAGGISLAPRITVVAQTESMERLGEYISELNQDNIRTGYENLSSIKNSMTQDATGIDRFINAMGGDDFIQIHDEVNPADTRSSADTIHGGSGNDSISSGMGDDTLYGDAGNDRLAGGRGADLLYGGSGSDCLFGNRDNDEIYGGTGADKLFGGDGADIIFGGADDDLIYGEGDSAGDAGRDTLNGGYGNDTLIGGALADTLTGGAGDDTFQYLSATDLGQGHTDVITDFRHWDGAHGDRIDLSAMDPNASVAGNQSFFFSEVPSTARGALWFGEVVDGTQKVYMNADGADPFISGPIELIVQFNDPTMTTLHASDFIF